MDGQTLVHCGPYGRSVVLEMRSSLVTHAHPQPHVLFKLGGSDNSFLVGREHHPITGSEAVLVNSWQPHVYTHGAERDETRVLAFYLEPAWMEQLLQGADIRFSMHRVALDGPGIALLREILEAVRSGPSSDSTPIEARLALAVRGVFAGLLQQQQRAQIDFRIGKALADLRENFGSFSRLEEVARRNGISRPHLFHLFRKHTEMTPRMFYNMCRMERALRELAEGVASVCEISDELGFTAQANFTRFFRQHQGISPIAYRAARQRAAAGGGYPSV
jgi:AraC-like DNA-binding protein